MISVHFKIKFKPLFFIALLITNFCYTSLSQELEKFTFESNHMGTTFKIVLFAQDSSKAQQASSSAFATIADLDTTLSDYIPHSELSQLSNTSGSDSAVAVSKPLFEILSIANRISRKTEGLFDVSAGPYVSAWRSIRKSENPELPSSKYLSSIQNRVGYANIVLNESEQTVRLLKHKMKLDVGGIGKGHATQKALEKLRSKGITMAYVDGGGDISVGAPPPGKSGWTIAVPLYTGDGNLNLKAFTLSGVSIATSGDLYQHITIDGTRYSHVIDPRTGLGATKQVQATVIAPNGALADALASTISIAGINRAETILNRFTGTAAYITQTSEDSLRIWQSDTLGKYLLQ